MTELQFYNKKTRSWETPEKDGKPIEFESREEAENWMEKHHPDAGFQCFDYTTCQYCGAKVYLSGFTNTCDCGADYNGFGELLAPRSQWGAETGETVSDILAADTDRGEG